MKRSPSDAGSVGIRYRAVTGLALLFAVAPFVASIAPSVVTTDLFIVSEDEPIAEDVYVAAQSGRVEGRIDGDLVITTGSLSISGTVTGDVLALTSGTVRIEPDGVIEGSIRAVSPQVVVEGEIRRDLFVTGIGADIGNSGSVGRDVIMFGGTLTISGAVGRDVRGRLLNTSVRGAVGRDIDLAVQRLVVEPGASVAGDVLYRSTNDASIAPGTVDGQIVQLPAQSNFLFGVILLVANAIGFMAFIVSGIILLWLFRGTGAASIEAVERHPVKTFFVGIVALIAAPLLVLLLAATLVGLPLAALLLVALLLALVFGPVPAVAAGGDVLLRRKGGLFGGFVVGAVLWRLGIWLIPFVGVFLYLAGLIWGVGGWVLGAWRVRSARPADREALPAGMIVDDDPIPEGWEYPLAPAAVEPEDEPPVPVPPAEVRDDAEGPPETEPPISSPEDPELERAPTPVPPTDGRGDAEERSDDAGGPSDGDASASSDRGHKPPDTSMPGDEPGDDGGTDNWGLPAR